MFQLLALTHFSLTDNHCIPSECSILRIMSAKVTLRERCPNLEFFWSIFSRIRTKCGEILCISLHAVQMHENADQKNCKYGHFLRSVNLSVMTAKSCFVILLKLPFSMGVLLLVNFLHNIFF